MPFIHYSVIFEMAQHGLFRKKSAPEPEISNDFIELTRRSRVLEERYSNLERRSQVMEENMIEHHRKLSSEIRLLNDDLAEMKKTIADLNEKMQYLAAELQDFARKEDVQALKKYLDYWDPLKFVTQNQVEKIVKELIDEKKDK